MYSRLDTAVFLNNREQQKIDKYSRADIPKGVTFVPFVISTSGVLGEKANIFLSLLDRRLIQADPIFNKKVIAKLRKSIFFSYLSKY